MEKKASKVKLMMSVGSIFLCTSDLSVAMEERLFNHEFTQRCGRSMEHINDAIGAQSALNFLSTWVGSSNPTIKQRTLQAAETLIKKWELDPPSWFSAVLPQAQATAEQIYREVSSDVVDEPSGLTEVKHELKNIIEQEVLHVKAEEGALPAILSQPLVEKLI